MSALIWVHGSTRSPLSFTNNPPMVKNPSSSRAVLPKEWSGGAAKIQSQPANELSKPCALVYSNVLLEPRCYTLGGTVGTPEH
jgi:hypothetical protein